MSPPNHLTLMPRPLPHAWEEPHPENVASAYHLPAGVTDKSCRGTACFVARHLDPTRWNLATQSEPRVHCLGKCYAAPAHAASKARPTMRSFCRNPIVLERLLDGGACRFEAYVQSGGYRALERAMGQSPEDLLSAVEKSELRGRGGAAFPVGLKWRMAARQPGPEKFIVANADEGDPGAFIDRFILEDDPHVLIEGMALAACAVGARKGWIYLRREYPQARVSLARALGEARRIGVLGSPGGPCAFDIELAVGDGSYICGEETALMNSLEGKRPVAMARPPYATEHGLFGKPTVINNVETFANIPWIIRHGAEAYRARGFSKSRGTKVVSLNSLFKYPGLYEVEFGISVRDLVENVGGGLNKGQPVKGLMIGGPLTGVIPPQVFDTPFAFEELQRIGAAVGHGGVIAFDEHTTIPELVHYIFSFGAYESCGKCTPCRLGAPRLELLFRAILENGQVARPRWREFEEIVAALRTTSLCGLGSGLADFAGSISRYYREELESCFK